MEAKQMSLFECTFDRFIIDRPIRLIELFAGIGAQSKALENLGADFESHRVVEWSCNSIIAYNAIHVGDFNDYSQNLTKEEVLERVRGVSIDYNKPATDAELLRRGEKWLRKLYSSMVAIKDLCPDVSRVHAEDLGITERAVLLYPHLFLPLPGSLDCGKRQRHEQRLGDEKRSPLGSRENPERTKGKRATPPRARDGECASGLLREERQGLGELASGS